MATSQSIVDDLLERLAAAGRVTARKMFGEYCLYLDEKPIALVCDDTLFVKPTPAGRALLPDVEERPPYPGAKPHFMLAYDDWTDRDALCRLARVTFEALPAPKPRSRGGNAKPRKKGGRR